MESNSRDASPPTITIANGFCESLRFPSTWPPQQAETGHQRGHHDGPKPQDGSLQRAVGCLSLQPQLVDEGIENDAGLHRYAHQSHEAQQRRDAEIGVRQAQRQQAAHRFGHQHAQENDDGNLKFP